MNIAVDGRGAGLAPESWDAIRAWRPPAPGVVPGWPMDLQANHLITMQGMVKRLLHGGEVPSLVLVAAMTSLIASHQRLARRAVPTPGPVPAAPVVTAGFTNEGVMVAMCELERCGVLAVEHFRALALGQPVAELAGAKE